MQTLKVSSCLSQVIATSLDQERGTDKPLLSHCHGTTTRYLCLCLMLLSHHTKIISCHSCKRNHVIDRLYTLSCLSLNLNLPFTSNLHPHTIASSSWNRNYPIIIATSQGFSSLAQAKVFLLLWVFLALWMLLKTNNINPPTSLLSHIHTNGDSNMVKFFA